MTYDAVLFDLYDTVAWSDWQTWQGGFADLLDISHDAMGRAFGQTRAARSVGANPDIEADLTAVIRAADVDPEPDLVAEVLQLEREMGVSVRLYEDSLEVVSALRARGTPTALVSNCSHNTRPIVDRLGLER